ncbi:MAG: dTDP-4-dehydrorhamnose 3,5-epimerase [Bacteriovoracaceae bacterium]|nr:dTDP-4-dehydrorhamnose 3,5-epimerase [Bacteriovoracaceae bacterium]
MEFKKTAIAGVYLITPKIWKDARGYFFECYKEDEFKENGIPHHFVQDNQSCSSYGVVRGLHSQQGASAQAKLVRVIQGKVLDVAVDIRQGSPTYGQHVSAELDGETGTMLFIPRGFLHGFSVLSPQAIFTYKCDNFYCKEAELRVKLDDPLLGIDWKIPAGQRIISELDASGISFAKVVGYRT